MEKILFTLLMGLLCSAPGLAPSAQPDANSVNPQTANQYCVLPQPPSESLISLIPAALVSNSTLAQLTGQPCYGSEKVLPPAQLESKKLRTARAKKDYSLKGHTSGNKNVDALIIASAARNQLDPVLLYAVIQQESAFNSRAVSPKGARGLMQLMPATATRFGVRNVFNPQQNIEAGARYLRFLLDTFEGDLSLALAAYNAGEGNVRKYMGQMPPFRETINYVSEIRRRYETINSLPLQTAVQSVAGFPEMGQ
jgi:soluble lytic murein transglycosylase-like protein